MKTIKLETRDVEIKTSLSEISLSEFEQCMLIYTKEYKYAIDQYIEIIQVLSDLTVDEIESFEINEFEKLINEIELNDFNSYVDVFKNEFIHQGITYKTKATDTTFKFSVKEMFVIQDKLKSKSVDYVSTVAAILFNDVTVITTEGIKTKQEIFKDVMTMDYIAPYLIQLGQYYKVEVNA